MDEELSPSRRARLEEHLKSCPSCSEAYQRLEKTRYLIRKGLTESAGTAVPELEEMLHAIKGEVKASLETDREKSGPGSGKRHVWGTRILIPSAVAMILVAAFIFTIYKPTPPVIETVEKNDCIIESVEGESGTVMLFKTHGSRMTVIWLSGTYEPEREATKLWSGSWV
jgi:hypothetical protein